MEVILKKTKLTSNIVRQIPLLSYYHMTDYDVLGWCFLKNVKWIILYNSQTHELRKAMLFTIEVSGNRITVNYGQGYPLDHIDVASDERRNELIRYFNFIISKNSQEGQFYL